MALEVVILAAGMGKRMHSALPKVLHPVAGEPLLFHVIKTACALNAETVHVVTGHGGEMVQKRCQDLDPALYGKLSFHTQKEQLGTAHAVSCAMDGVKDGNTVLVLYGDTPLPDPALLEPLTHVPQEGMNLLTVKMRHPFGYGRIVRDAQGQVSHIVEEKDATESEKQISEVNSGILAASGETLKHYLPRIGNHNAQGEYYLTDLTGLMVADGRTVQTTVTEDEERLAGVNNKVQLAGVERTCQKLRARKLMEEGVTLADPARIDIRGSVIHGKDCCIDINVILEGKVVLGDNVTIGAGCVIRNCEIGDNSVISPYTVMEDSVLKVHNTIGPFARLRPGNLLEDEVHVGNFVEVKKSHVGKGTKAGHLSYLGDSEIGKDVNIGAGTITCNYDGANKHRTVIGDDVFVGSDTQLVAPVTVEAGATIGAGTTVTRTVPAGSLVITRARPRIIENYARPVKAKKE